MTVTLPLLAVVAALQSTEAPQVIRSRSTRTAAKAEPPKGCTTCAADAARAKALDAREARVHAREQELSAREKSAEEAARSRGEDDAARKKKQSAEAAKRQKQLEQLSGDVQDGFKNAADALGGF